MKQSMQCEELSAALAVATVESLPADLKGPVEAHLAGCADCRAMVERIKGFQVMPTSKPDFRPEIIEPVRPMASRLWFVAVAVVLPLALATAGVLWSGAYGWQALDLSQAVLFSILVGIGIAALAAGFYRQFKPGSGEVVDNRFVVAGLLLIYAVWVGTEFGANHSDAAFSPGMAFRCFRFGLMVSVVTSGTLLLWARQGFAANPRSASVWTGAFASLAGLIALQVHCPVLEVPHLLLGHGSVIVVATYLIAWLARRVFGLR